MNIDKLLSLIPEQLLEQLAIETKVDHYAKKLQGEVIFKLLLYCIVSHQNNSLRTMESAYEKVTFQLLNQRYNQGTIRFSSISERLSSIKVEYFEKLYWQVVSSYKKDLGKTTADLVRFDSTIVALSSKLLRWRSDTAEERNPFKESLNLPNSCGQATNSGAVYLLYPKPISNDRLLVFIIYL